ncbi:hypothetical protein BKA70DRAFT_1308934 [Coprinopsis sp. MPI-PUGE-AT-0042]|nr:hypothetical protein BKA70DRAFT_1308934 [Coprinopsis sp. MPI-PUGE-AT-0042]
MSVIKLKYGVITPLVCVIIFILTFTLAPNLPIISSLSSYLSLIPIIDLSKTPMSSSSNAPWSSPLSGILQTTSLVIRARRPPKRTQEFRNTWILKALRTSQPIDRILVPKGKCAPEVPEENYEKEFHEVSVQGFNYEEREMCLPQALWELAGVVLEARGEGEGNRGPGDESVVSRVKDMVRNVF